MLYPRIIPTLLIHNKGLVKSVKFKDYKYVGDPINAVKIFNEKEVDELMVIDIGATVENREPDYTTIEKLATECRMPLCYGGGIKTVSQAERICNLGVEKVSFGSAALEDENMIRELAQNIGNQSVVAVLDVKKKMLGGYDIYIRNGKVKAKVKLYDTLSKLQELGVGEIVINSIDNDGMMKGYDFDLVQKVRPYIKVPTTILGGAGSLRDIGQLIKENGIVGAAAGSLFVFKGKYKAVLINYPSYKEKDDVIVNNLIIE